MKKLISLLLAGALALGLAACGKEEQGPEPAREQGDIQGAIDNLLGEETGETEEPEAEGRDFGPLVRGEFGDYTYAYHEDARLEEKNEGRVYVYYDKNVFLMLQPSNLSKSRITQENAQQVADSMESTLAESFEEVDFSMEDTTVDGQPAYLLSAQMRGAVQSPYDQDYRQQSVLFLANGNLYSISFLTPEALYPRYDGLFEELLAEIKILEKEEEPEPEKEEPASKAEEEPQDTVNWRSGSMFKVGDDIPAGEYYLEATGSRWAYMCVSSDASGELGSIVTNENFNGQLYITVDEGQYLELSGGRLALAEEVETSFDPYTLGEGMYKVGKDIPAGEYQLTNESDMYGYVCVYNNSYLGLYSIATNDNFEDSKYVSVSEGQYLYLSGSAGNLKE